MRILLVAPQPFFVERGTPIAVKLLAETLCGCGHEVDLLTFPEGRDVVAARLRILRSPKPPGVSGIPIGFSWKKVVADAFLCCSLARLVATNKYDVIHAVEEAIFPAAVLNFLARSKLVYDMDSSLPDQMVERLGGLRPLKRFLDGFESWALRRSDLVLPVCEPLAKKARRTIPEKKIQVLEDIACEPTGDPDEVEDLRETYRIDGDLLLYVGNLEHYQGVDLMLESLAKAPPDLRFTLVVIGGSEPALSHYQRLGVELGVGDRVRFAGPKPFAQLPHYLSQADILVSPRTKGENTPSKIYHYLLSGRPVLATNIGSHLHVLDTACAVLVDPDGNSMAAGLTSLLEDSDLRATIGRAGRALAKAKYSLASYKRKLQQGYARLLDLGGGASVPQPAADLALWRTGHPEEWGRWRRERQ